MKNEIKMLYKKDAKLAIQVAAALGFKIKVTSKTKLSPSDKKVAKGILQYLKAANKFKDGALQLMTKDRNFGRPDVKFLTKTTDKLIENLEAQEADKWEE